jgi:Peptidase family M1 domain
MNRRRRPHNFLQQDTLRAVSLILLLSFLASCAAPTQPPLQYAPFILVTQDPNASPTPTPFQPSGQIDTAVASFTPATPVSATSTVTLTAEPTQTFTLAPATAIPAPAATSAPPVSNGSRTNYILYATLDFGAHTLAVDETVRYYNNTGLALSDMVLSVQPNRFGSTFSLNSISQDNAALTTYILNGQRLTLNLSQSLQPGSATTLTLSFKLSLPVKSATAVFGYDFNQVNLADWYPFVVPYNHGWVLHDPSYFGEFLVYDSSDIEVNIKTGSDVVIAASAPSEQNGDWTRYRLYGARTFTLSASDEFLVSEATSGSVVIRSYYFDGYQSGGEGILAAAVDAVSTYESNFAAYPYQTLAIVEADIHDGQEEDGLVFLATDFYAQYDGSARNNLTTIGVHEIAHQWWYGLVGNDQALEPWLDEALAVYSERIFYENNYPGNISWWWQFRVDYFKPSGFVDSSVYGPSSQRAYVNAVYLNGAHFIDDLRERVGYGNFAKFLKAYAGRYSQSRATSADFFVVLRETINVDISDLFAKYFSQSY